MELMSKERVIAFELMEKAAIKAMDTLADYHFNPESVDERALRNAKYHIREYYKQRTAAVNTPQ